MDKYNSPIPKEGDSRYDSYTLKEKIDKLRILHYKMFKRDLSINGERGRFIRGDNIHNEYGIILPIKGIEKFSIAFATTGSNYVGINCDAEIFKKEHAEDFAAYIEECFKNLIGERFNLVFRHVCSTQIGIDYVPFDNYGDLKAANPKKVEFNNLHRLLADWEQHAIVELLFINKQKLIEANLPEAHLKAIMALIKKLSDTNSEIKDWLTTNKYYKDQLSKDMIYYDTTTLKKVLRIN